MTRDEAAWLEILRRGQDRNWKEEIRKQWLACQNKDEDIDVRYYIDPKYLRLRNYGAPWIKTEWSKPHAGDAHVCEFVITAPVVWRRRDRIIRDWCTRRARAKHALRRFWRAFKG